MKKRAVEKYANVGPFCGVCSETVFFAKGFEARRIKIEPNLLLVLSGQLNVNSIFVMSSLSYPNCPRGNFTLNRAKRMKIDKEQTDLFPNSKNRCLVIPMFC